MPAKRNKTRTHTPKPVNDSKRKSISGVVKVKYSSYLINSVAALLVIVFSLSLVLIAVGFFYEKNILFTDVLESGFTRVKDLKIGDTVLVKKEAGLVPEKIISIDKRFSSQQVYNFMVEDKPSTYLANDIVAHNKGEPPPPADRAAIGYHDGHAGTMPADQCLVWGWTCDPDNYNQPLSVHIYEGGTFLGAATANIGAEPGVAAACGNTANHRFIWSVPNNLKDGNPHTYTTYAIGIKADGTGSNNNPTLTNTPKTLTCQKLSVGGHVFSAENSAVRLGGVQIRALRGDGTFVDTTTDANGYFHVNNFIIPGWSYAIRPLSVYDAALVPAGYLAPARTNFALAGGGGWNWNYCVNPNPGTNPWGDTPAGAGTYECQVAGSGVDCAGPRGAGGTTERCDFAYAPAPTCDFTLAPDNGTSPLSVYFVNTSTHATEYLWNFGNGQTYGWTADKSYPGANPINYTATDVTQPQQTFNVTLTSRNAFGNQCTPVTKTVTVRPLVDNWFQVSEGLVHINNQATAAVPLTVPIVGTNTFFGAAGKGVFTYNGTSTPNFAPGSSPANFAPTGSLFKTPAGLLDTTTNKADYNYWSAKLRGRGVSNWNAPALPTATGIYRTLPAVENNPINIGGGTISNNQVVIIHNGSITITGDIFVTNNGANSSSALVVISGGDITVQAGVNNVQGVYIANGTIRTPTANPDPAQLYVQGSLIGWTAVSLNRDLGSALNRTTPSEKILYRPDIVNALRKSSNSDIQALLNYEYKWEEVLPNTPN